MGAWTAYLLTISLIAYFFTAFRISAIGLHGFLTGLGNSNTKAASLLVNFYPYLPLTPVNLAVSGAENSSQYLQMVASLPSITFPYKALLGISFLSLFLRRNKRFLVFLVLLFAASGICFSYLIETGFRDISQTLPMDFVRTAPILNYFSSCLATLLTGIVLYSTARTLSLKKVTDNNTGKIFRPVPPTVFWMLVIFMLLAPSLANVENVHSLERKGRTIIAAQK